MNVSDAIRQRRSIRDFLPRAVDEQTLREVLDVARPRAETSKRGE
jgi:nitroreductase